MDLKKALIISIIILVIAFVILAILLINNRFIKDDYKATPPTKEIPVEIDKTLQKVSDRNNYYIVKMAVNKFYTYYSSLYNSSNDYLIIDEDVEKSMKQEKEQNINAIYQMLDKEYIEAKNITKENLMTQLKKINQSTVQITEMYVTEQNENIGIYFVYGYIKDKKTNSVNPFSMMVKLDKYHRTYSIGLQNYVDEKYKNIKIGNTIQAAVPETIEKNQYNVYEYKQISDETYATDMFNAYKNNMIYNASEVYKDLDKEYKGKRFGTEEKFTKYAKSNIARSVIMQISKYQKEKKGDYTQYTCMDQKGNYYIFKETNVMEYTLILDTYTIDLPEAIERYNKMKEEDKTAYNIQKIFLALNDNDYQYIYNKLDTTFRNNNFKTETSFEKYMQEKFYKNNKIVYGSYDKVQDVYVYTIKIEDAEGKIQNTINKNFNIKLKEGTDFEFSFNIN